MKKFYNIEGIIRNGFKLSRDYEILDFNFVKLGDSGVQALAKSRSIKQITRLTISGNKLGPESAQALGASESLGKLQSLKLYKNKIGDEGVKHLCESNKMPNLNSLRLAWNEIGPEGARYISESANLKSLTSLSLAENKIGDEGLKYLGESTHLTGLEYLDIRKNGITDEGILNLSKSKDYVNLQSVDLSDNPITEDGKKVLSRFLVLNRIRHHLNEDKTILDLSKIGIGDVECEAIGQCEDLENLDKLYLELNRITDKGVRHLVESPYLKKLTLLSLDRNPIGDEGSETDRQFREFQRAGNPDDRIHRRHR